ncbi:MAG: tripartite tricarboxylate transporter TctB family protein [Pseudomonadota bacterium]
MTDTKLLGGAIALLGGAAILSAMTIGSGPAAWGPRMVPILAGLVMVATGLAVAFERFAVPDQADATPGREIRALWLILLAGGYALAIGWIGFLAATFVATPALLVLFGVTAPRKLIVAALLCPVALHIFFFELLGIFPPRAAWFDLADLIRF